MHDQALAGKSGVPLKAGQAGDAAFKGLTAQGGKASKEHICRTSWFDCRATGEQQEHDGKDVSHD
jgi:hypothetical protein